MGLTCLIKLVMFLYLIFAVLYHFSCIDVSFYFLVHWIYFRFSKWRPSAILDFHIFALFLVKKNHISAYFYADVKNLVEIGRLRQNYCVFSVFKMAAVRCLGFGMSRENLSKISHRSHFFGLQNYTLHGVSEKSRTLLFL